jgi:hypothetical protein
LQGGENSGVVFCFVLFCKIEDVFIINLPSRRVNCKDADVQ